MKKFNLLDLEHFVYELRNTPYVIIKFNEIFPNYFLGQDLDIFCYEIRLVAEKILNIGNDYVAKGYEIKVTDDIDHVHFYIDFYLDDALQFRFDLYQKLPVYKKVSVKQCYLFSVIENAVPVKRYYKNKKYFLYLPSETDDLLLRYIEYIEYFELRPDKIKHLNYITNKLALEKRRIKFLDKLHIYTKLPSEFPRPVWLGFIRNIVKYKESIINLIKKKRECSENKVHVL